MVNKISQATLVYLDLREAKEKGAPLPVSTLKWIEAYGIPNEEEVLKEQRKRIVSDDTPQRTEFYHHQICKYAKDRGLKSQVFIDTCKEAIMSKIPITQIANWLGLKKKELQYIINPPHEYLVIQEMLKRDGAIDSKKLCSFYRKLYYNGVSIYKLKQWTGLSHEKLTKIVKS